MPLTLVTGPANAAKAGWVLRAFREELARATSARAARPEPLLVVPTADAVEPYQRELAAAGAVFGGEVTTFRRLLDQIARRAGVRARPLGRVGVDRVAAAAVRGARLDLLAASAATPGFALAARRLFSELQRSAVSPERFHAALRQWAGADPAGRRAAYAEEVAGLYSAYRRRLEALGRPDPDGFAWAALDALRAEPGAWGDRAVFMYGFDDLTEAQLDAVEALVRVARAPVTLSLPYEPGRAAFAARAEVIQTLLPLAQADGQVVELGDRSEHYAPASRAALHHLERRLFEGGSERRAPNGSVRLLEAGGERAEAELVGAALLDLLRQGVAPEDVAVLVPRAEEAPLLEQVLGSYDIPVVRASRARARETRLGAGLLAFGRAALPGGSAQDVVTWLRTPGKLERPNLADRLDARIRRFEASTAQEALRLWEGGPLEEVDALAAAAGESGSAFLDALEAELVAIWEAPYRRLAAVLDGPAQTDARVAAELRGAAAELRGLGEADPELLGGPRDVLDALAAVEVRTVAGAPGGVLVTDPLSVRARRFRAVFVCGMQDGAFPRRPIAEPFLDDAERRDLARASGLVLPTHENVLARERHLFYSSVARAEEVLFLSFRSSDEEGEPLIPSPFLDDVRDLFTEELWAERGRRLLAEVTWPPAQAPTPLELRRAHAARSPEEEPAPLGPLTRPEVLAELAGRDREPAAALEAFAACGVRWLVESVLRPNRVDPDPEPMRRGSLAHDVLERTLRTLRERTGSARLSPETREAAGAELRAALRELGATRGGARARSALRGLEVDLERWLDAECAADTGMEPTYLEWSFGGEEDEHEALVLAGGMRVGGRVDRIDVGPGGTAVVRDYKNSKGYPRARWAQDGRLQAALYAAAARELLGLEPVGALYQPLASGDLRPRGAARRDSDVAAALVTTDLLDAPDFGALIAEMEALAGETAEALRSGRVAPCPERCTPRGCGYPGICRAPERAAPPGEGAE